MNWLLKNFWLKVVAFGLGFLVWIHVATEKTYNYEFRLPVTEITLKDSLALSKSPPESLLVSVSATGKQLLRRKWRQQGIRINASQFRAGRFNINLSTQNTSLVRQTAEITLDDVISPTMIQFEIDIESSVELPIAAALETVAADGFAVGQQIDVEPYSTTLIGPRSRLQSIDTIFTEPSRLGSLHSSVTVTLPLVTPSGYGFRIEPESVTVTIPVFPVKTRIFEEVPVLVFNAPAGAIPGTEPDHLRLELTGPPDVVDQLDPNALTLSVDYRLRDSVGHTAVKFDCPPGFRLRSISADSVKILDYPDADPGN